MPIFLDWENRPAVLHVDRRRAFAVLDPAKGWTEVDAGPVAQAGFLISRGSWERLHANVLSTTPFSQLQTLTTIDQGLLLQCKATNGPCKATGK